MSEKKQKDPFRMKIIISPAKKMNVDTDSFDCRDLPLFLACTQRLLSSLLTMSLDQLRVLWKCSEPLARQNYERLHRINLYANLTPAILAYEGIQYQYMAPGVFTYGELEYIQEHLRILSGFYGLLRPFDGVAPYRLEMQAKLQTPFCRDLYDFWNEDLGRYLSEENDLVVDLASEEYSRAARQGISPSVRWIKLRFGRIQNGKFREAGTQVKMARGAMVRDMAERNVQTPEALTQFSSLGYRFSPERSKEDLLVFVQGECE